MPQALCKEPSMDPSFKDPLQSDVPSHFTDAEIEAQREEHLSKTAH